MKPRPLTDDAFKAFLQENARNKVRDVILGQIDQIMAARRNKVSLRKIAEILTLTSGTRIDAATLSKTLKNPGDDEINLIDELNRLRKARRISDLLLSKIESGGLITKAELRAIEAEVANSPAKVTRPEVVAVPRATPTAKESPSASDLSTATESVPSPSDANTATLPNAGQCFVDLKTIRKETESSIAARQESAHATLTGLFGKPKKSGTQQQM